MPGIAEVQPVRIVRIDFGGSPVMLVATDSASIARRTRGRKVTAGDFDEMYRAAAEQRGAIIADNLAQLQKLKLGQMLEIATPARLAAASGGGHSEGLFEPVGHDFHRSHTVPADLEGRYRGRVPHLPVAGRIAGRGEGPHLGPLRA